MDVLDVFHQNDCNRWEVINHAAGNTVELESIDLTFPSEQI